MIDLAIGGVYVAILLGIVYWAQKTFVCEKTCKARGECVEGSVDSLKELMNSKFTLFEKLIRELIKKHDG